MCGITGYVSKQNISEQILENMCSSLKHRGPDDAGIYISNSQHVGFAHRRLSIVDLSEAGHQPMFNHDQTLCITFNGEIYNYLEIRKNLINKGYKFKSKTDTEVLIYAYQEYGVKMLEFLNGMFAFALYDVNKNIIFIARDRFGIKPLYFGFINNQNFAFASELKAITTHPEFQKELSYGAIGDFFKYRYIPAPRTIWKNIYKLKHANYLIFNINKFNYTQSTYYNLIEKIQIKQSTLDEVSYLLHDSIQKRLIADVDVGTFLSGGLDSSSITAIARKFNNKIKSFSIGFKPNKYSELPYSIEVANYIKTDHITQIIDGVDDKLLDKLAFYFDEPHADSSNIPTYLLSKMSSVNSKVILSGDGGDEVFAGYNWYKAYSKDYNKYTGSLKYKIKKILGIVKKTRVIPNFETYYNKLLLNRFNDQILKKCFSSEIYSNIVTEENNIFEQYLKKNMNSVRAIQYVDINTFMVDDILTKVDRTSMANSLEVRVPFLDHRLVEAVFSLPETVFPSDTTDKKILKQIIGNQIPNSIHNRNKRGFSAPIIEWKLKEKMIKDILSGNLIKLGFINKNFVLGLKNNKHVNGQGIIWMIFIFEKWITKWLK